MADQPDKNPYKEATGKRLRTLRKRLQKIEKYQETPDKLNEDQLQALDKKDQLIFAIKELEELDRAFTTVDQEVYKTQGI